METELVIGCPVSNREWIIRDWIIHAAVAASNAGFTPRFVLVGDVNNDLTFPAAEQVGGDLLFVDTPDPRTGDQRVWNTERYGRMVELRNILLAAIREQKPKFFLSLDSDILLHPLTVVNLLETQALRQWAGVGGKCFMTPTGENVPSYGLLGREGQLRRRPSSGVHEVDVIMAIKLMTHDAYNIDYPVGRWAGEDINWSRAVKAAGHKLGWDGRVASKHVMGPEWYGREDPRCGF